MRQPKHPTLRVPGSGGAGHHRAKRGTGKAAPHRSARGTKGGAGSGGGAKGGGGGGGIHGSPHSGQLRLPQHPHHPRTAAKKPAKRGLALGGVSCCAAEALAACLRLTGRTVTPAAVLALYRLTADAPDTGASVLETLTAAADHGLAGVHLAGFAAVDLDDPSAVILGVDLPGAHTVAVDPGGWWSWGALYDPAAFPGAVIEEAWTVQWAA